MRLYYHGTSKPNATRIAREGFNTSYGRFGYGAYFTSSRKDAMMYGDSIIEVSIDKEKILEIYYPDLKSLYPYLQIEEEEGVTELEQYIRSMDYVAVELEYENGDKELCVYETNIINIKGVWY